MAMSKKDLTNRKAKLKARIAELEQKVRMDPLKRNPKNHEELAKLRKELEGK